MTRQESTSTPLVQIGWLLAADERDSTFEAVCAEARDHLLAHLKSMFPEFRWDMPLVDRRKFPPRGALNPLPLLEFGVESKIDLGWDYALVVVPNGLDPLERTGTDEVPSSALEVGVASTEALGVETDDVISPLAARTLRLLGHLWGLPSRDEGPMNSETSELLNFSQPETAAARRRLSEVSDQRLEERGGHAIRFGYTRAFLADTRGIATDILGYSPWRLPFRMGRLTAAAAVSIVVFLLGAESWELGVNIEEWPLAIATAISIVAATIFLFAGQNLVGLSAGGTRSRREQFLRMRIVLFATLLVGMLSLWVLLAVCAAGIIVALPAEVPERWLGTALHPTDVIRYSAFLATLGVLAGALGGSLEAEEKFKAMLYFDDKEN
ncbi:MAG: hypothetical protein WA771_13775 [Chthoniobacterales bacterium]